MHRWLVSEGIDSRVVDTASIEVNRRLPHARTGRMAATRLLLLVMEKGNHLLTLQGSVPTTKGGGGSPRA